MAASGAPTSAGHVPLSASELDLLTSWIDTPLFWPDPAPTCDPAPSAPSFDTLLERVAADLTTLPPGERAFQRYLSLAHRASAECAPGELELERQALSKGLNLLSSSSSVHAPLAIDDARTLYRIDLRDFGWQRALELGSRRFEDVWEAIAATSPYSVALTGPAADQARTATGTSFPLLLADHVLDVALAGQLYYRILGIAAERTLDEVILDDFGVDEYANLIDDLLRRAATTSSRVTRADRIVQRQELVTRPGLLWQAQEVPNDGDYSIFEDPLGSHFLSQVMFTLPNGLFAFLAADPNGGLTSSDPVQLDALGYPLPASPAVTCSACHVSGLLPVVDEVKAVALRYAREIGLDAEEQTQIEVLYPDPDAFAALLERDSAEYYGAALSALGLATSGRDPVAGASLRFGAPLTLRDAAAELGVTSDVLVSRLPDLPWLAPLVEGTLSRDLFALMYLTSRCLLSAGAALQPDAAACELALRTTR